MGEGISEIPERAVETQHARPTTQNSSKIDLESSSKVYISGAARPVSLKW